MSDPTQQTDEEIIAELTGTLGFQQSPSSAPTQRRGSQPRKQRRTVATFDARAKGGPLDGLKLEFHEMSDGSYKLHGGQVYDPATVAAYRLDANERIFVWGAEENNT